MFFRIKTLVQKELRTLLRDPQSARLLIGIVILQLLLFPFAATMEVKNNTLAISERCAFLNLSSWTPRMKPA